LEQVAREVARAHEAAALFELSTFGKILVEGPDAEAFLDRLCANDMRRAPGRAIYSAMLNARGGVESDLTALRLTDERYRLTVGSAAVKRDLAWLKRHLGDGERVGLADETEAYAVLGLMGPEAARIAAQVGAPELNDLAYFRHGEAEIAGRPVRAARLSYVGEAGWEITCRAQDAAEIYGALATAGARPAGLFAQNSMRIEKRFLAYGHELDSDVTPLEAGLDFALDWRRDFIGREALLRRRDEGLWERLVTILLDDPGATPLGNEPVALEGALFGKTTSAAFGHRIGRPLALAYVDTRMAGELEGIRVEVDIAGESFGGTLTLEAAFDPKGHRLRRG
jgi:4-methylaminobutanoate oxidase (formaldehyde-forming)